MRKKLLSLVALAFMAIGISAQTWDIPEMPEPATVASDPVSGHIYHVRHVQASAAFTQQLREEEGDETLNVDAFIGGGQVWFTWSTTAKLTGAYEEDSAIGFTLTEEENGWTFKGYDGLWPIFSFQETMVRELSRLTLKAWAMPCMWTTPQTFTATSNW